MARGRQGSELPWGALGTLQGRGPDGVDGTPGQVVTCHFSLAARSWREAWDNVAQRRGEVGHQGAGTKGDARVELWGCWMGGGGSLWGEGPQKLGVLLSGGMASAGWVRGTLGSGWPCWKLGKTQGVAGDQWGPAG